MLNEYLKEPQFMTLDFMNDIHTLMIMEIGSDVIANELYDEMVSKSIDYAQIRARWSLMSQKERQDIDERRTMTHDCLIVKFNQLAKHLKMQGKSADWRNTLGYEEENPYNRKRIGDMGCYLSFISSLISR